MECKARYINDCRIPNMYNAIFVKDPVRRCAYVIASCSIKANQEIFVDYGKWYWAMLKPNKVSARYLMSKIDALV
jgi:SET domain-containing protein